MVKFDDFIGNEYERKWLFKADPPKDQIKKILHIEEFYCSIRPVVRLRKSTDNDGKSEYYFAVKFKIDGDADRLKIKEEIDKDFYDEVFKLTDVKPVEKTRMFVDIGNNLMAKIDSFSTGEKIIELEFPSKEVMDSFIPPSFFGDLINKNVSISENSFRKLNNMPDNEKTLFEYRGKHIDSEALYGY